MNNTEQKLQTQIEELKRGQNAKEVHLDALAANVRSLEQKVGRMYQALLIAQQLSTSASTELQQHLSTVLNEEDPNNNQ